MNQAINIEAAYHHCRVFVTIVTCWIVCIQKAENLETNSAGGWCKKASTEDGGQHMTDMKLVKKLSDFLTGTLKHCVIKCNFYIN